MLLVVHNSAPIALFVHARPEHTRRTVESLLANPLASRSILHVFSDGAREREGEKENVALVRDYVKGITGFAEVVYHEAPNNLGLATSIIDGVTRLFEIYDRLIVLEDDLFLSNGFLAYMNQTLEFYENHENVLSVSGYSYPIKFSHEYPWDVAFGVRASSWGWATWKKRWMKVDWSVSDYDTFRTNFVARWRFNRGGSDLSRMLDRQQRGRINSWAIRFSYHQFKFGMVDVFPVRSLVDNRGFGAGASNCVEDVNGWTTDFWLSPPAQYRLPEKAILTDAIVKDFGKFNSYSARIRRLVKRAIIRFTNRRFA